MSEEEVKFGINLGALFPNGDPEKEEQTPTEEVEEENKDEEPTEASSEDEVEESTTPKKEVEKEEPKPAPLPEVENIELPDPIDYLHAKWSDHGISKEDLAGDNFKAIVEVVRDLQEEIRKVKDENKELQNHPAITEVKISQKVEKAWSDNIKEWEEELREAIPDEYKQIQKLNKKQAKELVEFISTSSSELLYNRVKSSKSLSNPLLILAPKIMNKVKDFTEDSKKETTPEKPQPKKMASLSGGVVKPQQEQHVDSKRIAPQMMPAQASFKANIDKLFGL